MMFFRRPRGKQSAGESDESGSAAQSIAGEQDRRLEQLRGYTEIVSELIARGRGRTSGDAESLRYREKALSVVKEALLLPLDGTDAASAKAVPLREELKRVEKQLRHELSGAPVPRPAPVRARATPMPSSSHHHRHSRPSPLVAKNSSSSSAGGRAAGGRQQSSEAARNAAASVQKPANENEARLRASIEAEVVDGSPGVKFDDVAGLSTAKQSLQELVILPTLRADIFQGLRAPARGLLLFGPPGNGKTMLAKAVATEANCTFFSISASSMTSKWVGEGEKLVRTLFKIALERAPSIIFIDEIDSLLSARKSDENEASRRLKTEFLVQMDGVTSGDGQVIVIGATNRPDELDDAVIRRLVKRILIPLPDEDSRRALLQLALGKGNAKSGSMVKLSARDLDAIVRATEGYSASDLRALCSEAAMVPIRELGSDISSVSASQIRPIRLTDFQVALRSIRPSTNKEISETMEKWAENYGVR